MYETGFKPQQNLYDLTGGRFFPSSAGALVLCTLNVSITKEELGLEKCASFLNLPPALLEWAWQWTQFSSSVLILSMFERIYFLCTHMWIPTFGNVTSFLVEKIQTKVCDKSGPFPHMEKQRSLCKAFTSTEHCISQPRVTKNCPLYLGLIHVSSSSLEHKSGSNQILWGERSKPCLWGIPWEDCKLWAFVSPVSDPGV